MNDDSSPITSFLKKQEYLNKTFVLPKKTQDDIAASVEADEERKKTFEDQDGAGTALKARGGSKKAFVPIRPVLCKTFDAVFPSFLEEDIQPVVMIIPQTAFEPVFGDSRPVMVCGEDISSPGRIYNDLPDGGDIQSLTPQQQLMLYCYLTMHHDGYARERFLGRIYDINVEWVAPFIFNLVGEYVYPIIEYIDDVVSRVNIDNLQKFAHNNPEFMSLIRQRCISYYDCYHDYVGDSYKDYKGIKILQRCGVVI